MSELPPPPPGSQPKLGKDDFMQWAYHNVMSMIGVLNNPSMSSSDSDETFGEFMDMMQALCNSLYDAVDGDRYFVVDCDDIAREVTGHPRSRAEFHGVARGRVLIVGALVGGSVEMLGAAEQKELEQLIRNRLVNDHDLDPELVDRAISNATGAGTESSVAQKFERRVEEEVQRFSQEIDSVLDKMFGEGGGT